MSKSVYLFEISIIIFVLSACNNAIKDYDASGSFEAIERTISAEATGTILSLMIEEGQLLNVGDTIGSIDNTNLYIQGEQAKSIIKAIAEKTNDASAQINILQSQLKTQEGQTETLHQQLDNLEKEIIRFQNLVNANAVPQKQLDDIIGQQLVLQKQLRVAQSQTKVIKTQIASTYSNVNAQNRAILSEVEPNKKKLDLIQKQIDDGIIINNHYGIVTTQLAYDGEFTTVGKPLYKIADLSHMTLRAYISGNQLPEVRINQEVIVKTDDGQGGFKETKGIINWISSKAEFTPKTIQTKNERANLVYAIKVKVTNDGTYKMGMYGEIKF